MAQVPRIVVVGAGLAGLCLAQGLRKAGMDVAVYERDASASSRAQGYRISMDLRGTDALRACLPPKLYELFGSTRGQPSLGVTTFSSAGDTLRLEHTMRFPQTPQPGVPAAGRAVDRLVVRETLLAGLDDVVHFDNAFTHYEERADGVQAHFADGTSVMCDLVVAADGVGSRVRQQFFPNLSLMDTGMRWLGGRTVVDQRLRSLLPDAASESALSIKDSGKDWFLASVFFQQSPNEAARAIWPELQYTDNDDFLMWSLIGRRGEFAFTDEQLLGAATEELHALALDAVQGCHPMLREFVEAAARDRGFSLGIRAVPVVDAWPSSSITFVGDAIHASPVNGTGANSALEDAALLCRLLWKVNLTCSVRSTTTRWSSYAGCAACGRAWPKRGRQCWVRLARLAGPIWRRRSELFRSAAPAG
jgi:2-polyprenyl-6-methoxyphenol hydroxylase-like FAD-dependent oxidoreductase